MRGCLLLLTLFAAPLAGQEIDDKVHILTTAAEAVRSEIVSDGSVAIQQVFLGHEPVIGDRHILESVASNLGASQFTSFGDIVVCNGPPSTCRLSIEGAAAFALERPSVDNGSATVVVHAKYRSNSQRQPVASQTLRVSLTHDGEAWKVTGVKTLRVS